MIVVKLIGKVLVVLVIS